MVGKSRPQDGSAQLSDSAAAEPGAERDHLRRAARRVFETNGYRAATLPDIAAESGLDLATVQATFPTVRDAMYAVFDDVTAEARPRYAALDNALVDPDPAVLTAWIDDFLDWSVENRRILRIFPRAVVLDQGMARYMIVAHDGMLSQVHRPFEGLSDEQRFNAGRTLQMLLDQLTQSAFDWYHQGADPAARQKLVQEQALTWRTLMNSF